MWLLKWLPPTFFFSSWAVDSWMFISLFSIRFVYHKYCLILFEQEKFKLEAKQGRCAFLGVCFIWAGKQPLCPQIALTYLPSSHPFPFWITLA